MFQWSRTESINNRCWCQSPKAFFKSCQFLIMFLKLYQEQSITEEAKTQVFSIKKWISKAAMNIFPLHLQSVIVANSWSVIGWRCRESLTEAEIDYLVWGKMVKAAAPHGKLVYTNQPQRWKPTSWYCVGLLVMPKQLWLIWAWTQHVRGCSSLHSKLSQQINVIHFTFQWF